MGLARNLALEKFPGIHKVDSSSDPKQRSRERYQSYKETLSRKTTTTPKNQKTNKTRVEGA